jgi:superfamily II DNA/RNA helicase
MSMPEENESSEALAVEYHTPESMESSGFTFHAMQQRVYQQLMDGESVILSAPTSFGKSIIVDALVASKKWQNMVFIVPTIALIDETRRRLAPAREEYTLVTHPTQEWGEKNLFLLTQERFLELPKMPSVDFFMIDEFYKLGAGESHDSRRSLLNIAWSKLRETGAQHYLIGPNVDALHVDLDQDLRAELVTTDFKTVATDIEDRSDREDQLADLQDLVSNGVEGASLVFVGSPAKAAKLGVDLAQGEVSQQARALADWIAHNYDPEWFLVPSLRGGVGVHTGPMPRSIQRAMVRLFNEEAVNILVCTSTLIEGVNTAAKNVIIFEKKIDGQALDFFTFSNIRGRAGRMARHFVGRVITYSEPPATEPTEVDIPIETQSSLASLATLVQLDEESLTSDAQSRMDHILHQDDLSLATIRKNRGLNPERQLDAAVHLKGAGRNELRRLSWRGRPSPSESKAVLNLAFDTLLEPRQRRGMNFSTLWGKLQNVRSASGDLTAMVDQQMKYKRPNQSRSDVVDDVLSFQRNWMGFTIPSMIRGLQNIQAEILPSRGIAAGNYEFLLKDVESLYLPSNLIDLEEYGLPLPLAQKLVPLGLTGADLPALLRAIQRLAGDIESLQTLDPIEKWFLADVAKGL